MLEAKAACYDPSVPLSEAYRRISSLHVRVSEQQQLVRQLLLRKPGAMRGTGKCGRDRLAEGFALVDLYELVTAIDYDYLLVRGRLGPTDALGVIRRLIGLLAGGVAELARPAEGHATASALVEHERVMAREVEPLQTIAARHGGQVAGVIGSVVRNMQAIAGCVRGIRRPGEQGGGLPSSAERADYRAFLSRPPGSWRELCALLSFRSAVFRFALRLAALFCLGGVVGRLLTGGEYAYWLLLTVIIVARPGFVATRERNLERIFGTLGGVLLGIVLLLLIPSFTVLLILAAVFLWGFFAFFRLNYAISVFCITPAVVISLAWYEGDVAAILGSRVAFTLLGCLLAIGGWYLFPVRQKENLPGLSAVVLATNRRYFQVISRRWRREEVDDFSVRLARKEAHVALAGFSDGLKQLKKEPGTGQLDWQRVEGFHLLAYRVNALVTGLSLSEGGMENFERMVELEKMLNTLEYRDIWVGLM